MGLNGAEQAGNRAWTLNARPAGTLLRCPTLLKARAATSPCVSLTFPDPFGTLPNMLHPTRTPVKTLQLGGRRICQIPADLAKDLRSLLQNAVEDLTVALHGKSHTVHAELYGSLVLASFKAWEEVPEYEARELVSTLADWERVAKTNSSVEADRAWNLRTRILEEVAE